MKHYTFSQMNRLSGEILDAALEEPITLTKRGKERLVILTAARYRLLMGGTTTNRPFTLENAPDDVHEELAAGLEAILEDEPARS